MTGVDNGYVLELDKTHTLKIFGASLLEKLSTRNSNHNMNYHNLLQVLSEIINMQAFEC